MKLVYNFVLLRLKSNYKHYFVHSATVVSSDLGHRRPKLQTKETNEIMII